MSEAEYGLKKLTVENWLQPDQVYHGWYDGEFRQMSGEDWARQFLSMEINPNTPIEVQRLFNVARGNLLYGYFYHPLYTMGLAQILRVAEAAAKHKCRELGRDIDKDHFHNMIVFMVSRGVLAPNAAEEWHATKDFRNATTHADDQMILPPGTVSALFGTVVRQINSLFP